MRHIFCTGCLSQKTPAGGPVQHVAIKPSSPDLEKIRTLHPAHSELRYVLSGICLLASISVAKSNSSLGKEGAAQALNNDIVTINRMPEEDLKDRLNALSTLMGDGKLDSLTMQSLDKLRFKAQSVAEINHSCGSVSLNSIPDPRCNEFYLKELPAFEQEYSKVTGNVYMNRLTLAQGMKDRRSQINACVQGMEAFLNPDFAPQKFASLKVTKMDVDPVDDKTIDVSWTVQEVMDEQRVVLLNSRITAWKEACDLVTHNADGKWNPYFLSQSKSHFMNSPFLPEGDYVYYREVWKNSASLNGTEIYSKINPATKYSHISVENQAGLNWRWDEFHRGKERVSEGVLNAVATIVLTTKVGSPMTDRRDGKVYQTVLFGGKTWMSENLNYAMKNSRCYQNDTSYCSKYGRLYDWNTAMKACPQGWHVPTDSEWDYAEKNGLSPQMFRPLPGGYFGAFLNFERGDGTWWSSTEKDYGVWTRSMNNNSAREVYHGHSNKDFGFSLRCVKN